MAELKESAEKNSLLNSLSSAMATNVMGQAKQMFSDNLDNLSDMVKKGPKSLSAMCFMGGVATALMGFFGMLNVLNPFGVLISAYNFIFGLTILVLEIHTRSGYLNFIYKYIEVWLKLLTTLTGRSLFYLYIGSLMLAQFTFLNTLVGAYMCACGFFSFTIGRMAQKKLDGAKDQLSVEMQQKGGGIDEDLVEERFKEYAGDDEFVDAEELGALCDSLDRPLSKNELDQALDILDVDGSGKIDLDEFKNWLLAKAGGDDFFDMGV